MDVAGKVAVITGSTSGLGLAMAKRLSKKAINIVITGFADQTTIDNIIKELKSNGVRADYIPCDLRKKEDILRFCDDVTKLYPEGTDILINNAGIQYVSDITEFPDDKWDDMVAIMLTAPFHLTKRLLPAMKAKGWGRIVNISSQVSAVALPGKAPYTTVKHGNIGFTKGVALDVAESGVTCNAVCPTFTLTPLVIKQIEDIAAQKNITFEEAKSTFVNSIPVKKAATPEQVASLVEFLVCSEALEMITGSSYFIDGGYTAQ